MTTTADLTRSPWAIFLIFVRLGLTSFGGPVAHLAFFRDEFVNRRRWLDERAYADLVALCQFLPGPASSQVGMALGLSRAGCWGALAAWAGFTLPSALAMMALAAGLIHGGALLGNSGGVLSGAGVLHGLQLAAVAVVAHAAWGMARHHAADFRRAGIALVAAIFVLALASPWVQWAAIAVSACVGLVLFQHRVGEAGTESAKTMSHPGGACDPVARGNAASTQPNMRAGALALALCAVLLMLLPLIVVVFPSQAWSMADVFYRAGSLVFGGGHVVLPLLQAEVVPRGWVSNDTFLAGYGAAQALPGPLFSFAAFLGAASAGSPSGWLGGFICLVAIFTPAFLLIAGALPFWESVRRQPLAQAALSGINAAVVGLLLAALLHPICTSSIISPKDFGLATLALAGLAAVRLPPWLVVLACAVAGGLVA